MAYNRATIMDAFNAAGHFTQQALGYMDEAKRREADAFLRNIPAEFSTDIQNLMRDNPFNYTGDPDNYEELKKYTEEYNEGLSNYARDWYAKKIGNKSAVPYIKRHVDQMQAQAVEALRNAAFVKQDEWRVQREHISREEDNGKYLEAVKKGDMTPQQALASIYNRIELSGTRVEINPQQKNEMRKVYTDKVYKENAAALIGRVNNLSGLEAAKKKAEDDFSFMPSEMLNVYDKDGKVTGTEERPWSFNGKDEWLEKAINGRAGEIIQGAQGEFERLITSGNFDAAIAFGTDWGAALNRCYKSKDGFYELINDPQRNQFGRYFDLRTLKEFLSGGGRGTGKGEWQALGYFKAETFFDAIENGGRVKLTNPETGEVVFETDSRTYKEARDSFIATNKQIYWRDHDPNNPADLIEYEKKLVEWTDNAYTAMEKVIKRSENREIKDAWDKFTAMKTYMTKDSPYYNKDIKTDQLEDFSQTCISYFSDFIMTTPNPTMPQIERAMKTFTDKGLKKILDWGQTPNEEGDRWKKQAELSRRAESPEADSLIFTDASGKIKFPTPEIEEQVMTFMGMERQDVADVHGVSINDVKWGWTSSGKQQDDVTPKAYFIIEAKKGVKNPGIYRLDYDDNDNKRFMRLTTNPKYDDGGNLIAREKDWTLFKQSERPKTKKEEQKNYKKKYKDIEKSLKQKREPHTNEQFDYTKEPPPGAPDYVQKNWNKPNSYINKLTMWTNYYMNLKEEHK